ncbi:L-asparaginase [Micractinium conductrix]|uniref:asparaginase n=1 Tax=Micractinium conductrix TaxID=554055 RepID=A0A2P6VSB4_9CHLO|nr:L-asparaginase [Micractinium conductrix]|eukprot:PSC76983.1 L-asparaginase [Micractinium conductrix]
MLSTALAAAGKLLCLTGAMLPADQLGADGPANLRDAIQIAGDAGVRRLAGGSVLLALNQRIHLAQYVRKADSSLTGAFHSHPGPIGEVRGGRPLLYYAPVPPPQLLAPAPVQQQQQQQQGEPSAAQDQQQQQQPSAGAAPSWLPHAAFQRVRGGALAGQRVAIWTLTAGALSPPEALLQQLDGLVLAGSGTGSLSAATLGALAPWTAHLPCVVASRCGCGANHDDFCYRGSLEKYENRGFILRGGYEELNPLQARALLVMRLAALGRALV